MFGVRGGALEITLTVPLKGLFSTIFRWRRMPRPNPEALSDSETLLLLTQVNNAVHCVK